MRVKGINPKMSVEPRLRLPKPGGKLEVIPPPNRALDILVDVIGNPADLQRVATKHGMAVREVQAVCQQFAHTLNPRMGEAAVADTRMWTAAQMPVYNPY